MAWRTWGLLYLGKPLRPPPEVQYRQGGDHPCIGIYEYDIAGRRERGVMSTEVRGVMPEVVNVGPDGFDRVRYDLIGGV